MSFNQILKSIRLEAGYSLRGLADKTGVNFSYIDKIERGLRPMNLEILEILLNTFPEKREVLVQEYVKEYVPKFLVEELKRSSDVVTKSIKALDSQAVFEIFFKDLDAQDRAELFETIIDKFELQCYKKGTIEKNREKIEVIRKKIEELKKASK